MGSHPDKVKLTANETMESIQEHFVNITKAYKSSVVSFIAIPAALMWLQPH